MDHRSRTESIWASITAAFLGAYAGAAVLLGVLYLTDTGCANDGDPGLWVPLLWGSFALAVVISAVAGRRFAGYGWLAALLAAPVSFVSVVVFLIASDLLWDWAC